MGIPIRTLMIAVTVVLFWAMSAHGVCGDDIYVDIAEGSDETGDGSSGNPYANITTAVENATEGDTVIVMPGTYSGPIEITTPLTLISDSGPEDTIIELSGYRVVWVAASNTTVSGFTIRSGAQMGIDIQEADNCTISDNIIDGLYNGILVRGTYLDGASYNVIERNNFTGNYIGMTIGSDAPYTTIRDNTVCDNDWYSYSNDCGIKVYHTQQVKIENNTVDRNGDMGIYIASSDHCTMVNNSLDDNTWRGIYMTFSTNCTLSGNSMSGNDRNLEILGDDLFDYWHFIDENNSVDGRPIYYWTRSADAEVPLDAGYVGIVDCSNVTVRDLSLYKNGDGVVIVSSSDCLVENITSYDNVYGIHIRDSDNCTVRYCDINESDKAGIRLYDSNHVDVTWNDISEQSYNLAYGLYAQGCHNLTIGNNTANWSWQHGLYLLNSHNSFVSNNTANGNIYGSGIYLNDRCDHSLVENNNASGNGGYGIYIYRSYYVEVRNNSACGNDGGYGIRYTGHDTFRDNLAWGGGNGFELDHAGNITIQDNVAVHGNMYGVKMMNSEVNDIRDNDLSDNRRAVSVMSNSDHNLIRGNDCTNSIEDGINVAYNSNGNNITGNTIVGSGIDGIRIEDDCLLNTIAHNEVTDSSEYGIRIMSDSYLPGPSTNNTIYDNYLDNDNNAYDNFTNIWNVEKAAGTNIVGGSYLGGNYYSDYLGVDEDEDGLGDSGHEIDGGSNVDDLPLYVYQEPEPPTADFAWEPELPVNGTAVVFLDLSDPGNAEIVNWTWELPYTGLPITPWAIYTQDPTWKFTAGTYNVSLTVRNGHGLTSTATKAITIGEANLTANFTWEPARPTEGEAVTFEDTSTPGGGEIVNWTWDLPYTGFPITPGMVYSSTPSWTFAEGTHNVSLTVRDELGSTDTVSKVIVVGEDLSIVGPYVEFSEENGTFTVTAGVNGNLTLDLRFLPGPPGSKSIPNGTYFEVLEVGNGTISWVNITFMFPTAALLDDPAIYYWDEGTDEWRRIDDALTGTSHESIWANLTHLTVFAVGDDIGPPGDSDSGDDGGFPIWAIVVVVVVLIFLVMLLGGSRSSPDRGGRRGGRSDDERPGSGAGSEALGDETYGRGDREQRRSD